MITAIQSSLFADLADDDAPEVPFVYCCSAGHAKRHTLPRCSAPSLIRCKCGKPAKGAEIIGTRNGHRCDARCMFATGPNCECSCGGANHAIGWNA